MRPEAASQSGFSLVEVIMAMLLLSVGLLGMAATTTTLVHQTTVSGLKTHRVLAVQEGIEQLRASPYDSVSSGSISAGIFGVSWSLTAQSDLSKTVRIITVGPGLVYRDGVPPVLQADVPDTFSYRLLRP